MDEFDEPNPATSAKPSKTPSWIMLGFMAGALFVWALQHGKDTPAPASKPAPVVPATVAPVSLPPRLSDVEAVFEEWKRYAVWANDTTYVCWSDPATGHYRDCFEVVRRGEALFFRSVPRPRNLRAIDGVPATSPLEFLNPVPEVRGLFGERIAQPVVEPPPGLPAPEK
jgi:hypothetical protein